MNQKIKTDESNPVTKIENQKIRSRNVTEDKSFINSENFPDLKVPSKNSSKKFYFNKNSSGRSWLSVVNKESKINTKESFPALHSSKKNEANLKIEKKEMIPQVICDVDNLKKLNTEKEIQKDSNQKMNANPPSSQSPNHQNKSPSPKKIPVQPPRNPHKKKTTDPVLVNFQEACEASKPIKRSKLRAIQFKKKLQRLNKTKQVLSGNYLDSSNPKRSRGKHREIKKTKLTKFKVAIIKERIIKQKMRENALNILSNKDECFNVIENIDFKNEIKIYLEKLSEEKKVQKSKSSKGTNKNQENKNIVEAENVEVTEQKENSNFVPNKPKEKVIPNVSPEGEVKFSSKFREYCDNMITPELNSAVSELIEQLVNFQDRLFVRDPVKAKSKKKHVSGIREVKKYLTLKKVKLIIIAPNLEKMKMEDSLYNTINELKTMADSQNVLYGFALDRYKLGKCTRKFVPVSAFAVLNNEGVEALYEKATHHLVEAKKSFEELIKGSKKKNGEDTEKEDVNLPVLNSLISAFRETLQVNQEKG